MEQNQIATVEQRITAISQDAQAIQPLIMGFKVTDEDSNTEASAALSDIKERWKAVEGYRLFFTAPLNKQVKEINAMFKSQLAELEKMEKHLKLEMANFYRKKEEEAMEEARKAAEREEELRQREQEALALANSGKEEDKAMGEALLENIEQEKKVEELIAAPSATTRSGTGATTTARKVWRWEVVDAAALMAAHPELFVVDPNKVKAFVQSILEEGVHDGIRLYQEISMTHRS